MARHVDHHPATPRDGSRGVSSTSRPMPWLADSEVGAARRFVRRMAGVSVVSELSRRAPAELAELVPADVTTWDRIELATGVVPHAAVQVDAESPGAFAACLGSAAGHPVV